VAIIRIECTVLKPFIRGEVVNKKLLQLALVASMICVTAQAQTRTRRGRAPAGKPTAASVEDQLKALERQWLDAYIKHDPDAMSRIEADDFTITYPDGSVRTRAEEVEAQRKAANQPADPSRTSATEDEHIRVYGNSAILTGVFVSSGGKQNPNAASRSRYTDVYIKRGGVWQVVASQLTAIPDPTQKRAGGSVGTEVTTPSGLKYADIVVGTGPSPKPGDRITVNYVGTLENGEKFDSSYDRGQPLPIQIGIGMVIKGWDEGVMTMRVGGKRKLIIPPQLGYGQRNMGTIPPNSTLIFEVELLSIQ
jgi:peptidylprolyl isomerase